MSLQVVQFDEERVKKELKECPKIVQDYVKLLTEHSEMWKAAMYKAIAKLREKGKETKDIIKE